MSRRTRLIITALFLVLLAIPAAYVICTWHPEAPLRFLLVERAEIAPLGVAGEGTFEVTVANASHTPIRLMWASLSWPERTHEDDWDVGHIFSEYQERHHEGDKECLFIPPRTTRICTVHIQMENVTSLPSSETGMNAAYYWCSDTKGWFLDACNWLREHTPRRLHSVIPTPNVDRDEAKLQSFLPGATFGADLTPLEPLCP